MRDMDDSPGSTSLQHPDSAHGGHTEEDNIELVASKRMKAHKT